MSALRSAFDWALALLSAGRYTAYSSNSDEAMELWARVATGGAVTKAIGATSTSSAGHRREQLQRDLAALESLSTTGSCNICTEDEPCLFDLLADPSERVDISKVCDCCWRWNFV